MNIRALSWLLLLLNTNIVFGDTVDVQTQNGTVRGSSVQIEGRKVWQFLGIPFAEPPLGPLRLRPSIPVREKWPTTLIADKSPHGCLQTPDQYFQWPDHLKPHYSEDCLYLSIWSPEVGETQRKAVMVYIHGGGYSNGEALPVYTGLALSALGDVVVVAIQYRLGFLGFARLDDKLVPGNMGMFDQQRALRWVQENVVPFGGDPNRVTIFGESAGGASVSLHMMNEESGKMFHRAILQSGNAFHPWAFYPESKPLEHLYRDRAARDLNCPQENTDELLQCLQGKSSEEFLASFHSYNLRKKFTTMLGATVDGSFMSQPARDAVKNGKLQAKETIIGVTEDEGGIVLSFLSSAWRKVHNISDPSHTHMTPEYVEWAIDHLIPHYPHLPHPLSPLARQVITRQVLSHDPSDTLANGRKLLRVMNQYIMHCETNTFADHLAGTSPKVYHYQLARKPAFHMWPNPSFPFQGAIHGDELPYVFGHPLVYPHLARLMTDEDKELSRRMIGDFTSFAKTGQPRDPNWRPYTLANREYYRFDVKSRLEKGGVRREDCVFWDRIMPLLHSVKCREKNGHCSMNMEEENETRIRGRDEL